MTVYVDTPRWERWHGLSGHLVADDPGKLEAIALMLGLDERYRISAAIVPHYQLPAAKLEAALAAGVVPLDERQFRHKISELQAKTPARPFATAKKPARKRRQVQGELFGSR